MSDFRIRRYEAMDRHKAVLSTGQKLIIVSELE